ncbi:MAG: aminotransferase class V-fold PLP-dependent enzyme [Microthrixaceae bacterium]
MSGIDVARARAATPGCATGLHLDHAGSSLMSRSVLDAVVDHLRLEADLGGYAAAAANEDKVEATYDAIATLLGCGRHEVALSDSSTRGWMSAIHALPIGPEDRVVTTRAEYGSNAIALLQLQRRTGCHVDVVEDDADGQVDLAALAEALAQPRVALMSLTHVPTQSGLVNPAAAVGRLCRDAGVVFALDACQAAGQLPLDVAELGCQILAGTGRKFLRGPRGTGFMYIEASLCERLEPPVIDMFGATWTAPDRYELQPAARRFELWESDVAARVGLGVAVQEALSLGLPEIAAHTASLAHDLRTRLEAMPRVSVQDRGAELCAIVTFTVEGVTPAEVVAHLRAAGATLSVAVSTSAQLDLPRRGLDAVVRASVHYLTTDDELDRFSRILRTIVG